MLQPFAPLRSRRCHRRGFLEDPNQWKEAFWRQWDHKLPSSVVDCCA